MLISGTDSSGIDYSRYYSELQLQRNEANKQQEAQIGSAQQPEKVEDAKLEKTAQSAPPPAAQAGAQTAATTETSSVAEASKQIAQMLTTGESDDSDTSDQALINKANAGSTLTSSELSRLKTADPALYAQVVKAQQAREELLSQMRQNPSSAKQAALSAMVQNNSEGQEITRKALADEYTNFAAKYDQVELNIQFLP